MCHCDDCRHITGLLSTDCVVLPSTQKDLFDHDHAIPKGLSVYRKKNGIINWYFCQECGAHIVQYDHSTKRWLFSTGLLHPLELDDGIKTIKMVMHSFVKYGRDQGGMTQWLPDGLPRYIDVDKIVAEKDGKESTKEEKEAIEKAISATVMPMTCHCGHVQINIHRPSSKPLAKEWESCNVNDAWLWTFCLCNSCRTTSGFDANCFLFAPYTHITNVTADADAAAAAKSTIKSRHATDGLKVYISYPGRRRHFCPTCGACVFFDRDDRGDLSDVFLGLADVPVSGHFPNPFLLSLCSCIIPSIH